MIDADSIAEMHARMAECAIISGEPAKAHAAIERCFVSLAEAANERLTYADAVVSLDGGRTATLLHRAGIHTIGDLCGLTFDEVREIQLIGKGIAKRLQDALAGHGLHLRPSTEGVAA
ncbi:hypothetical protein [Rhodopirellula sp. P2]|uniref:hypothetical protein n=1 Tax=Rhodopirellula sp. P2 TaxID=2127060 RepID=UPI002367D844|nr:hypothetical protein [Rhodopirellula sp. P2]WDQ16389.1 hypothetical protein PSR62_22600 [Rhodopirellula sp. P2]